jgi:hypothetical protein
MGLAVLFRCYPTVFTDGQTVRRAPVEASSLAHARERAANIARGMMDESQFENWSGWHIIIETDEGQSDDPFPAVTC